MKKTYLSMAIAGALLAGTTTGFAAQAAKDAAAMDEYALDEVVVTATRSEKKDVDVPAATVTITAKQIKESGAKNALDVLAKVNGIAFKSFGPRGAAMGTMINEVNIRGIDNGTLILVNGNPVSWRGKYNVQEIPAESIERIEIVKGGGSVLYGSEAMAGVVNIITKTKAVNQATIGFGNYGQQNYQINAGDNEFSVNYSLDKWNHLDNISESTADTTSGKYKKHFKGTTTTNIRDIKNESMGFNWHVNERMNILYNHYETKSTYARYVDSVSRTTSGVRTGDLYNDRTYTTVQDVGQVNYHDGGWKGSLYFNTGTIESNGAMNLDATTSSGNHYNTREKNSTYGADVQKSWQQGKKTNYILGVDLQHEIYQSLPAYSTANASSYMRNNWGVFGQWEQKFDDRNSLITGIRETWTTAADRAQNYNNFSASGQFLHKLNTNDNVYASIGQSFIMPTFAQMYGASSAAIPNPDLKPQTGVNYEVGWKRLAGNHHWKAAAFHTDIKDNISASWTASKSEYTYTNEDFRNTGIELSCDIAGKGPLSYNYGLTWQNPESKSSKKGYWDRKFGRIQLTGGITWRQNKWTTSLTASYLADRVQTPSTEHSFATKPYLLTTLTASYQPDDKRELTLTIDNLLDRRDNLSHSSSSYYNAPFNFMMSYTQKW